MRHRKRSLSGRGRSSGPPCMTNIFSPCFSRNRARPSLVKTEGEQIVSTGVRMPAPGGAPVALQLYAGPKEYDTLRSMNAGLEDMIDFGFFIFGSWSFVKVDREADLLYIAVYP